ncbi:OsmC family protein [Rhodohalobacter sp. 8-1]|uniref:OsmC family protein n=1 Tax=Rhodohalobacter sp. 8-1 TaxID=3131972 RepID=UPI0030EB9421
MNSEKLRELQSPLKSKYKENPEEAIVTLSSIGKIGDGVTCKVDTGKAMVEAGLHPATGGDGMAACSGDMLLDALVACAGVTLNAVATAIEVDLGSNTEIRAEGDLDFRGTLGVDKEAPVGFKEIRLTFHLDTNASEEQIASLIKLTERYCVVFQTLNTKPGLVTKHEVVG